MSTRSAPTRRLKQFKRTRVRRPPQYRESPIQKSIVNFLEVALPIDAIYFSIPNEGRRTIEQIRFAKAMGLRAGMPDLGIVYRGRSYFLEVKDPLKGRLSKSQGETIPALESAGALVATVTSPEMVEQKLQEWGFPLKAKLSVPKIV